METSSTSDAELMARVARTDRDAFAALITRHQDYVLRLAYRFVGRWDVAEDLAQETFLRVYHAAAGYRPTAAFPTWLYRIVLNLCRDWRRGQTYRQYSPLDRQAGASGNDDRASLEDAEVAARVQAAIAALPDAQREALVLHRYGELSHREIAAVLGKSESAIESYLVRAYANLRKSLSAFVGE